MRKKDKILKNHAKNNPFIKKSLIISEELGHEFNVETIMDKGGWYTKHTLTNSNTGWTEKFRDIKNITIKIYDGDIELIIHENKTRKKQKIKLSTNDLADLYAAIFSLKCISDKTNKCKLFSKRKVIIKE